MEAITVFFVFTFAFVIGVMGGWIDRGRLEKKKQKQDLEAAFNAGRTTNELDPALFQQMGWKLKYLTFDDYLKSEAVK